MYNKERQELQTLQEWLLLFFLILLEHFPIILRCEAEGTWIDPTVEVILHYGK